jgi:hypothetical protein
MRLISSKTLQLKEFFGGRIPKYAILSHTWKEEEEVSFKDMQGPVAKEKKGFAKLQNFCAQAARDGFEYAWIDTCCIGKSSSAELSEAINSMYKWYKNAQICYAYLADVSTYDGLKSSRWFTRGWTLQELIAPSIVIFYDKNWNYIGTKSNLDKEISRITGIDIRVLRGCALRTCSVQQRMFWASKRTTTRDEDKAYCLMGLFNVHMPLIYGEGETKALKRLREEIKKEAEDCNPQEEEAEDYSPQEEEAEDYSPQEEDAEDYSPQEEEAEYYNPQEEEAKRKRQRGRGKEEEAKRRRKKHYSPQEAQRQNQYFINGDGIDTVVIVTNICRYLGNDALVKPGVL